MKISRTVWRELFIYYSVFFFKDILRDKCATLLILPGFGIVSHIIVSAAKKPIFGYLGMVYGAPLRLFFRYVF